MPKYKVLSNLKHNGTQYKEGDEIELSEQAASPLLEEPTPTVEKMKEKAEKEVKAKEQKTKKAKKEKEKVEETNETENVNLKDMTRAELNEYAAGLKIENPEGFANKKELLAAITEAGTENQPSK